MKEQVRLWFYSMLFMSTVLVDEPPYEQVGTTAWSPPRTAAAPKPAS